MPRRVEIDPEGLAWLKICLQRPQSKHLLLTEIEIGHVEIKVSLLGLVIARPDRWFMIRRQLKGDRRSGVAAQFHPTAAVVFHRPPRNGAVKGSQGLRIATVDCYEAEAGDTGHTQTLPSRDFGLLSLWFVATLRVGLTLAT